MAGDQLTIQEISERSGKSIREIFRSLRNGSLLDQSSDSVNDWIKELEHTKIERSSRDRVTRESRTPIVHRKWD